MEAKMVSDKAPMSQSIYEAKVEKDIYVKMRDGTQLCVDIYRPNVEGKFPALFAMSPYGKNTQRQLLPQPLPLSPMGDACCEAGDTNYLVSRGYVHVIADSRGTGQSQGEYYSMYSKQEAEDGYELVEWIAEQPWCDGNIGMIGISYYGTIQLVVASEQPPHLKAICPFEATTDQYLACYHGGALDGFYTELATGRHSTLSWHGYTRAKLKSWTQKMLPREEFERRLREAINDPDIIQYNLMYSILDAPEKNPVFFDILLNPFADSEYWWNPKLENIKIPVFCGVGWFPNCGPKFVRGPFMVYQRVQGPKKLIMFPPGWLDRPFSQYHALIVRWYDYWLKGIDTGIMDEPPVKLFITGDNRYRYESEWPLKRTKWTNFYLGTHGRLSTEPEPYYNELPPDGFVQEPLTVTTTVKTVKYATPPLSEDVEVTGPISLYLYASIDAEDSILKATVYDVDSFGRASVLTHGHLKLSHRALDKKRAKPWQPFHLHTREAVKPVPPGAIQEYAIELYPFSNVFSKGHQIQLEISSLDVPGAAFSYHVCSSRTVSHKVYRDGKHQSRLYLPVIPRKE